jgi:hypothetical protein
MHNYIYLNLKFKNNLINFLYYKIIIMGIGDWGLGIGDWGLGVGAKTPTPQPQTPTPNK